ncbi:hypothetical protein [Clostridium sp. UBA1056]|uniref:hypothetical protein n=1 Tax=unclassified Clostridium TaxID=2614128 RepID=UPI003217652F
MINTSPNYKKHYKISNKLYIIAPILCFIFIVISVFANIKEKEYKIKNNELSTEIETLKTTNDNLNKINKNLLESKSNLDVLIDQVSETNN